MKYAYPFQKDFFINLPGKSSKPLEQLSILKVKNLTLWQLPPQTHHASYLRTWTKKL
jgi:hypothetical protein